LQLGEVEDAQQFRPIERRFEGTPAESGGGEVEQVRAGAVARDTTPPCSRPH